MKIPSPLPKKRGRIEIIPLIDIMFFLLAAFMVVSINKIKVKSLKVALPTDVPVAQLEPKEDFITVSINSIGAVQVDKDLMTDGKQLLAKLQEIYAKNKDQKFLIAADKDSRNGDVIAVLGKLRTAGFQKVAFNLKGGSGTLPIGGAGGVAPESSAPEAPAPEAPSTATTAAPPSAPTPAAPAPNATAPPSVPSAPAAPAAPAPPAAAPAPPSHP